LHQPSLYRKLRTYCKINEGQRTRLPNPQALNCLPPPPRLPNPEALIPPSTHTHTHTHTHPHCVAIVVSLFYSPSRVSYWGGEVRLPIFFKWLRFDCVFRISLNQECISTSIVVIHRWHENAPETDSESLKFKNFPYQSYSIHIHVSLT